MHRVAREGVVDRDRVAVGVEQPADPLDGGADVAQVAEPERRGHQRGAVAIEVVGQLEPDGARPVGQVEGAGVPAGSGVLDRPAPRGRRGTRSRASPANGVRTASRIRISPVAGRPRRRLPRSSVGLAA